MLFSIQMKFSPEAQPVRDRALDEMVKQGIFIGGHAGGVTLDQLERDGIPSARGPRVFVLRGLLEDVLSRLTHKGEVERTEGEPALFRLSEPARSAVDGLARQSQRVIDGVVRRLLRNTNENPVRYAEPFVRTIAMVFAELAEEYMALHNEDQGKKSGHFPISCVSGENPGKGRSRDTSPFPVYQARILGL
jgi:hypothetical protein